ncbi:MAG: DUF4115 domain-containing protein [Ignavibacteriales bacterium]|nr:DUF4115 domain-containing protein [Ignavibacteriales bacterium]
MTLEEFGRELQKLRQERRVSLMDISSSTRINLKFLEAIEAGRFSVLPQTYIRAFLKEYADAVSAPVEEILKKYDKARQAQSPIAASGAQLREQKDRATSTEQVPSHSFSSVIRKNAVFAGFALAALTLTAYLISTSSGDGTAQPPSEVSFDNVVKETEAATTRKSAASPSVPILNPPRDSLRLEMATRDSVWMSILIDGKRTEEYLFAPNRRKTWVAKQRFSITMGNAGGATFILNGKELGVLGKRGAVIRNAIIEDSTQNNL